jgi:hypothetical protein
MACDSRVTGGFISPVQTKVIVGRNCLVGYCGDVIAAWGAAQYLAGELKDAPTISNKDDVLFLMYRDGKLYLVDGELRELPLTGNKYYAIGSGEQAAMVAMHMGATAKEAVQMAIRVDQNSGGRVREFSL